MKKATVNWTRQEPGWYTSRIGSLSRGDQGEWFFRTPKMLYWRGPFKTLAEAKKFAENRP